MTKTNRLNICIISRKNLEKNTRITRQALALQDKGHHVTVIAGKRPYQEVLDKCKTIDFEILPPFTLQLISEKFGLQNLKRIVTDIKQHLKQTFKSLKAQPITTKAFVALIGLICAPALLGIGMFLYIAAFLFSFGVYALIKLQSLDIKEPPQVSFTQHVVKLKLIHLLKKLTYPYRSEIVNMVVKKHIKNLLKGKAFDVIQMHDSTVLFLLPTLKSDMPSAKIVFDAVEVFKERTLNATIKTKPNWLNRYLYKQQVKNMKQYTDKVLTFGPGAAKFYKTEYDIRKPDLIRNCRYFYNPKKKDTRIRQDAGLKANHKLVVITNSLYTGQGLEQVVDAMTMLDENIHIATVGWDGEGGAYTEKCLNIAKEKGVADRIHLMGQRTTEDLVPYISGGDIGIIPMQYNGTFNISYCMPNRVFELIMARLPIAATSLNCIKALVNQTGAGMVFDETDPKDIARVITKMLAKETLKTLKHDTEQTARLLCWENESRSYTRIIENVAKGNNGYEQEFFTDAYKIDSTYIENVLPKMGFPISEEDENHNTPISQKAA